MRTIPISETLRFSILLSFIGGFLDAYSYLCRGGVFATAQTGNIVLLGLSLADQKWDNTLHYLIPILAFSGGIVLTEFIRNRYASYPSHSGYHWKQLLLLVELVLFTFVAAMPETLNFYANSVISLACGIQVHSFSKIYDINFSTTMCTGNLRSGIVHLYGFLSTKETHHIHAWWIYTCVNLVFIVGAISGYFAVSQWKEASILCCLPLLLLAFLAMFTPYKESN